MVHAPSNGLSRRGFLAAAGSAALVPLLAACASPGKAGGSGDTGPLKFWDMPWGSTAYNDAGKQIVAGFKPAAGKPAASYQVIQWNNFNQTFASAIASKTGPAVSSGGAFQAFQYAAQGSIAYADNVIATLKKNGQYDDFLPGIIEEMKVADGYAAVPWQVDIRPMWYRQSLLEKAGVDVPTDWDSFLAAGKALKAIGVYGFGTGAGPGNNLGPHAMVSWLINNGGGYFDEDGHLDCVTDRNIEAMEYIRELVSLGIVDPGAVSYTTDNLTSQWKSGHVGMGINTPSLDVELGDTSGDIRVTSPLTGPHGDKGTMRSVNNLMMYTNTPSQADSEALLLWYLDHMSVYWEKKVVNAVPARKSIVALPAVQSDAQMVKIIDEWQPIGRPQASRGTKLFAGLAALDGNQQIQQFAQTILAGKTPAKTALQTLQGQLASVIK